jgi:hypothetical protein
MKNQKTNLTVNQSKVWAVITSLKGKKGKHFSTSEVIDKVKVMSVYQIGAVITTLIEKGLIKVDGKMIHRIAA